VEDDKDGGGVRGGLDRSVEECGRCSVVVVEEVVVVVVVVGLVGGKGVATILSPSTSR